MLFNGLNSPITRNAKRSDNHQDSKHQRCVHRPLGRDDEGTEPLATGAAVAIACPPIRATSQVDLFLYAFTPAAAVAGVTAPAVVITAGTGFTLNATAGTSWRWRVLL